MQSFLATQKWRVCLTHKVPQSRVEASASVPSSQVQKHHQCVSLRLPVQRCIRMRHAANKMWVQKHKKLKKKKKKCATHLTAFELDCGEDDLTPQEVTRVMWHTHTRPSCCWTAHLIKHLSPARLIHFTPNWNKEPIEKTVINVWLKISAAAELAVCLACAHDNCFVLQPSSSQPFLSDCLSCHM